MIDDTRDIVHMYRGESLLIPAVTGDFCPACNEAVLDAEQSRRVMETVSIINKQ